MQKMCLIESNTIYDRFKVSAKRNRRELHQPIKGICEKLVVSLMLTGERQCFPLRPGTKQGCCLSQFLVSHTLVLQPMQLDKKKGEKGIQILIRSKTVFIHNPHDPVSRKS